MSEPHRFSVPGLRAIQTRYSGLAETPCCLSCGGAISFAKAAPGEVCLDLGSGRGNDVMRLAENVGESGHVYGLDMTETMIAKARRTAEKLGVKNVSFLHSELETIDLPDQSVDLVISNCTINHARDKRRVWSEVFRVLRPGGRFVVSDIYALSEVPAQYREDPEAVAECWAGAVIREEYLATLNRAGFSEVRVQEESPPYQKGKIEVASITLSGVKPGNGDKQ